MIKIVKSKREKFDFLDLTEVEYQLNKKISVLFLKHDAFNVSLVSSNGTVHNLKLGAEVFKTDTKRLLALLIKVYPKKVIDDLYYTDRDVVDYMSDCWSIFEDINGKNEDESKWTVCMHKNTMDILSKIFVGNENHIINEHIVNQMMKLIRKNRTTKEIKEYILWNLYKILNTKYDIGIQLLIHTADFRPLANLLLIDYMYELLFNEDSRMDDSFLHTRKDISDRMDQTIRILNVIGRFGANYIQYNAVASIMNNAMTRLGLPGYIARNIIEERYSVNNNIGISSQYDAMLYERSIILVEKIREFINFHNMSTANTYGENFMEGQGMALVTSALMPGAPERVFHKKENESVRIEDVDNVPVVQGIAPNYTNMEIILYRDIAMAFDGLKERARMVKDSVEHDEIDRKNDIDSIIYDLKGLYDRIQSARMDLRHSESDCVDFATIEEKVLALSTELQNCNYGQGNGAKSFGIGEGFKFPNPFKKILEGLNAIGSGAKKLRETQFGNLVCRGLEVLIGLIPGGLAVANMGGDMERMLESRKTKKETKKKMATASEAGILYGLDTDGILGCSSLPGKEYATDKEVVTVKSYGEGAYGENAIMIGLVVAGLGALIAISAKIIKMYKNNKLFKDIEMINAKLDYLLAKEGLPSKVRDKAKDLKKVINEEDEKGKK